MSKENKMILCRFTEKSTEKQIGLLVDIQEDPGGKVFCFLFFVLFCFVFFFASIFDRISLLSPNLSNQSIFCEQKGERIL